MTNFISLIRQTVRLFRIVKERYITNCISVTYRGGVIEAPFDVTNPHNVYLDKGAKIRPGAMFINSAAKIIIKKYVTIAPHVTIVTGNHTPTVGIPFSILSSTHINDVEQDIIIEEDAWICTDSILLKGTYIGRGAIVGAGSIVNNVVPPYAVVVGSPAKIVCSTFSIDQILEHEKILYPQDQRFTREQLQDLFEKHYKGMKHLGESDYDIEKYAHLIEQKKKIFNLGN